MRRLPVGFTASAFVLVMAFGLLPFSAFGKSEPSCASLLSAIENAYVEIWEDPQVYCVNRCHLNVGRLYQALKNRIPHLQESEVNVIYIMRPDRFERDEGFSVFAPRGSSGREVVNWRFHVVLEYQGYIMDLDRRVPRLFKKSEYRQGFFADRMDQIFSLGQIRGPAEKLLISIIPGPLYLKESFLLSFDSERSQKRLLKSFETQPFLQWLTAEVDGKGEFR